MKSSIEQSIHKIRVNYQFYEKSKRNLIWDDNLPVNKYIKSNIEKNLKSIFTDLDIKKKKILDVGCGYGWLLAFLHSQGVGKNKLYGIDFNKNRISLAKKKYPFNFRLAEATKLPVKDNSFDIIAAFVLFSSILDKTHRKLIADEMLRVLKKDGIIILYDIRFYNPFNRRVVKINKTEIKRLFKNRSCTFTKATINPILLRRVYKVFPGIVNILEKFSFLKSHYLTVIQNSTSFK